MKLRPKVLLPQAPFPVNALYEKCYRAVFATQRKIQSPLSMVATLAIGVMSEAVQGLVSVQIPNGPLCPVSNWVWLNAETGMGKTPTLDMLRQANTEFEMEMSRCYQESWDIYKVAHRAWKLELKEYEQAIRRAARHVKDMGASREKLADHMANEPKPPRKFTLTYKDATPEAFSQGLGDWPNSSLINDEAASCLNGPMGLAMAMLNQRWELQSMSIKRASWDKPIFVEDPRVMLILAIQPVPFQRYMERRGEDARELGSLARFLWCMPDNNQGWRDVRPVDVNPREMEGFYQRVKECLDASVDEHGEPLLEKKVITFSPEAAERYHSYRAGIERDLQPGGSLQSVKDYAAKATRHLARIAAVMEFFESGTTTISLDTLERAHALLAWYVNEFIRIFSSPPPIPQEQRDADLLYPWLHQWAQRRGNRYLMKGDIRKNVLNELRDTVRLERAYGVLQQRGFITQIVVGKLGGIDMAPGNFFDQAALEMAIHTHRSRRIKSTFS
jgi:hypothetical protein